MMLPLNEPTVFRSPTSFARFADFAVDRFTKFMIAKSNINPANCTEQPDKPDVSMRYRVINVTRSEVYVAHRLKLKLIMPTSSLALTAPCWIQSGSMYFSTTLFIFFSSSLGSTPGRSKIYVGSLMPPSNSVLPARILRPSVSYKNQTE